MCLRNYCRPYPFICKAMGFKSYQMPSVVVSKIPAALASNSIPQKKLKKEMIWPIPHVSDTLTPIHRS